LKKYLVLQIKVKEENVGLPKTKNHQDDSTIACIDKIYKESFSKFIDFCWIVKYVVPVVKKIVTTMWQRRFLKARA
jgi:retron-type reverse transcriptase